MGHNVPEVWSFLVFIHCSSLGGQLRQFTSVLYVDLGVAFCKSFQRLVVFEVRCWLYLLRKDTQSSGLLMDIETLDIVFASGD